MYNLSKWVVKGNSATYMDRDTNTFYRVRLCQMDDGMLVPYEEEGKIIPTELLTKIKKIILGGSLKNERKGNQGFFTETRSRTFYGTQRRREDSKKNRNRD